MKSCSKILICQVCQPWIVFRWLWQVVQKLRHKHFDHCPIYIVVPQVVSRRLVSNLRLELCIYTLLQNVGVVHQSPFTRLVNSLLLHWSPFTTTSEFTQNPVKSFGVHGHLLLQCTLFNSIFAIDGYKSKYDGVQQQCCGYGYRDILQTKNLYPRFLKIEPFNLKINLH